MDRLQSLVKDSRIHTFIVVAAIGAAIWYFGPNIQLGEVTPLASQANRLFCLLALAVFWGVTNLRPEYSAKQQQQRRAIQVHMKRIDRKLRQTQQCISGNFWQRLLQVQPQRPWFLVAGPAQSGKSTFLAQLQLGLQDQEQVSNLPTYDIACWTLEDAVFLELGEQFFPQPDALASPTALFQALLKLLSKRGIHLGGVIIPINIADLQSSSSDQTQAKHMREMLTMLQTEQPNIPVNLTLTKCDQIAGFSEYFAELNESERSQAFGIEFPAPPHETNLLQLFQHRFAQLVTQLNHRLVNRLHDETNTMARRLIADFPVQLDLLRNQLERWFQLCLPNDDLHLRGIYFTSCHQQYAATNYLANSIKDAFGIAASEENAHDPAYKTFFVNQMLQRFLAQIPRPTLSKWQRGAAITAIFATLFSGAISYHLYAQQTQELSLAKQAIARVSHKPGNWRQVAETLESLSAARLALVSPNKGWQAIFAVNHHPQLINEIQDAENRWLKTVFIQQLDTTLAQALVVFIQNNSAKNQVDLYNTLKLYLMLHDKDHFDQTAIKEWFQGFWKASQPPQRANQLSNALNVALSTNWHLKKPDESLINHVRTLLNQHSQADLVLTVLESKQIAPPLILPGNEASPFIAKTIEIPSIYTRLYYDRVYNLLLPMISKQFASGDWILGHPTKIRHDSNTLLALARTRYLQQYHQHWQQALNQLQYKPTTRLDNYLAQVMQVTSSNSAFWAYLQLIQENTRPLSHNTDFNQEVSQHFAAFNRIDVANINDPFPTALRNLRTQLLPIAGGKDPATIAFNVAKERMQHTNKIDAFNQLFTQAKQLPQPLKNWAKQLSDNGWQLVLGQAQAHIDQVWQQYVMPEFRTKVSNRYPVLKTASNELTIEEFTRFFAPNGIFARFTNEYITPFIDKENGNWSWRKLNGQQVHLSDTALATFIRGQLIQLAYFPQGTQFPSINFSLRPVKIDDNIKYCNLSINGQRIECNDSQSPTQLNWPGPGYDGVALELTDTMEQQLNATEPGLWGWFRLLEKAEIHQDNATKQLKVTLIVDGKKLTYQLYTEGNLNPFSPQMVSDFRPPQRLSIQ